MSHFEEILQRRKTHENYDEELWSVMEIANGRNLRNLSEAGLRTRLNDIETNIQALDKSVLWNDAINHNIGWQSPWWWFRSRHWTILEFQERRACLPEASSLPYMQTLHPDYGSTSRSNDHLVRISKIEWLSTFLNRGTIRLGAAKSYLSSELNDSRHDDELRRTVSRPGQALTITGPNGLPIIPIGDVIFSQDRAVFIDGRSVASPYWLCSFSRELDPRLLRNFASDKPEEDGFLIIFDRDRFLTKVKRLFKNSVNSQVHLLDVTYFDNYFSLDRQTNPIDILQRKNFRFACQREARLVFDPAFFDPDGEEAKFFQIGSISDFAGLYDSSGHKLDGSGPRQLFVDM